MIILIMSTRRKKRPYDSHATRERILDAAMDVFQRRGYHATSVQDLLDASGVPGGSMYHCFPTKKGLALAVIGERVMQAVESTWIEPVRSAKAVEAAVIGVFRGVADGIDRNRAVVGCPVTNLAVELSGVDRDFQRALDRAYGAWERALRERFGERRSPRQAAALATLVVASFAGAMSLAKTANSSLPLRQCAERLREVLKS